jgi:hypothetical protein
VGDLVGAETEPDTEGRPQLVDEIESMCMHCEQNVSTPRKEFARQLLNLHSGGYAAAPNQDSLFPRSSSHVLLLQPLPLQKHRDPIRR